MQYENGVHYEGFECVDSGGFIEKGATLLPKSLVFGHSFKYYEQLILNDKYDRLFTHSISKFKQ